MKGGGVDHLESHIEEKIEELTLGIIELALHPDHVHLFITGRPKLAPNKIIQQIKGDSSRVLRDEYAFGLLGSLIGIVYLWAEVSSVS